VIAAEWGGLARAGAHSLAATSLRRNSQPNLARVVASSSATRKFEGEPSEMRHVVGEEAEIVPGFGLVGGKDDIFGVGGINGVGIAYRGEEDIAKAQVRVLGLD
jgi:hypothetical protein